MRESLAQIRAIVAMLLTGVMNSLRRRQGNGALYIFPLLLVFLLVELARFGSRATDGMRAVLGLATPAKGLHYASLWLTELFVAIVALKFARIIPGRGSRSLFDQPLLRALPTHPVARFVVELGAASAAAVGFVILVWVPSVWGLHASPDARAVALTALSALVANLAATVFAMALYVVTARRLGGRPLDALRVIAAVVGFALIAGYSALGPIGAGVSTRLRVSAFVPAWSGYLPMRPVVTWLRAPHETLALGRAALGLGLAVGLSLWALLRRLREPYDLSLDAATAATPRAAWEPRLGAARAEFRALVRQAPYLPFAAPAFLAFFLTLSHGATSATGADLPLIVLMGLTAWATVVIGTALSGALSRRWRRVLWIPSVLGRDHTDSLRAATAVHTFLTAGLAFSVFALLLGARVPEPLWFLRMVAGLLVCLAAGQWLQVSAVFLLIDPSPDRLTGLSVGALLGVLATSLPTAALMVLLSATPLAQWLPLVSLLVLTAWSIERAAVARLGALRDPLGDPDAALRSWPALRTFGIALIAQVVTMQTGETVLALSPSGNLLLGYLAFAAVALPIGLDAARRHRPAPRWSRLRAVALGALTGALNFGLATLYAELASRRLGGAHGALSEALTAAAPTTRAALIAVAALLGPFAEELFFRGWLLYALPYDLGPRRARLAPVLTALSFAVLHAGEAWLPALVAGLLAGLLAARSRRLDASVAMHITNNSLVMATALGLFRGP